MVYVMVQGSQIRGVFNSVWEAKVMFNTTTGVPIKSINDQIGLNGDILFMIDNYCQARLKKTKHY